MNDKYLDFLPRFVICTRPPGEGVYEVLVTGTDSVEVLHKISGVISDAGVNFVFAHGQVDETGKSFTHAFFCDMASVKVAPEELAKRLRTLPFVADVRLGPMKGMMFEKFMFPVSSIFADRVLNLRAGAFVAMQERLVEIFGTAGETMSYEQGKAYAQSTVEALEQYRQRVGAEWDIDNIQDMFRAEGWGVVTVTQSPDGYDVRVKSTPVTARGEGGSGPGRFVVGLLVGMLGVHSKGHLAAGPLNHDAEADEYYFSVKKVKYG